MQRLRGGEEPEAIAKVKAGRGRKFKYGNVLGEGELKEKIKQHLEQNPDNEENSLSVMSGRFNARASKMSKMEKPTGENKVGRHTSEKQQTNC